MLDYVMMNPPGLVFDGAFTPASLPNFTTWFDPFYGVYTKDGSDFVPAVADDPVYRWVSRNSASIYLDQATLANCPIYKLGANGKYHLQFDGSNDYFDVTGVTINRPCTIFAGIYNGAAASTWGAVLGGSTNDLGLYFRGDASQRIELGRSGVAYISDSNAFGMPTSAWSRLIVGNDGDSGGSGAGSAKIIVDGTDRFDRNRAEASNAVTRIALSTGAYLTGSISHLFFTSDLASAASVTAADAFLDSQEPT